MKFKINLTKDLLYLLIFHISYFVRFGFYIIIIDYIYHLNSPYIFLFLMTLGEFFGGSFVYIYQKLNLKKKKQVIHYRLQLTNKIQKYSPKGKLKKIILIFFAAVFDFIEFIIIIFYVSKVANLSPSINIRLGFLVTISSSFVCTYALKYKIGKHHKFSLILFILGFLITLIIEFIYKLEDIPLDIFILALFLLCIYLLCLSFNDIIERYLSVYYFANPFFILMCEGIIEFIMSILYSINEDIFKEIINQYKEISQLKFAFLIISLIVYFICSAILNLYKIYCNAIYTPMAKSYAFYFSNPIILIYYFTVKNDFNKNIFYFFISEIIALFLIFCGAVYNEYIILYFFGLEYDTKDAIFQRALEREVYSSFDIDKDGYIIRNGENDKELIEMT